MYLKEPSLTFLAYSIEDRAHGNTDLNACLKWGNM